MDPEEAFEFAAEAFGGEDDDECAQPQKERQAGREFPPDGAQGPHGRPDAAQDQESRPPEEDQNGPVHGASCQGKGDFFCLLDKEGIEKKSVHRKDSDMFEEQERPVESVVHELVRMEQDERKGPERNPDQGIFDVPPLHRAGGQVGSGHLVERKQKRSDQKKADGRKSRFADQEDGMGLGKGQQTKQVVVQKEACDKEDKSQSGDCQGNAHFKKSGSRLDS